MERARHAFSSAWLRPFGVAGAVTAEFPISRTSTTIDIDPATGRLGLVPTINGNILHWGLALEFSTLYLTNRFTGGPPKEEPLNQFVPLVEFAFDTPIGRGFGHKTAGTSNPGLSHVAETWQLAAEAILPTKSRSRPWCGRQNPAAPLPGRFGADAVRKAVVESIGLRSNQAHVPEALSLHQFLPGKRSRGGR
jgi:hypothetical protein